MKFHHVILITIFLFSGFVSRAQDKTQTVRGVVLDRVSQTPLPGAMVVSLNSDPPQRTMTDADGAFRLPAVPVGKQSFKISMVGYKDFILSNITVNSGKEVVVQISLEEDIKALEGVTITAKTDKTRPLNEMSMMSTRTFSVEETQKYAAAVNDPGRMASSFAGVVSADDGNNNLSIRGNSPNGLQWRMEGVEIPSPNHFSAVGTSGGGISILSTQLLANSDFSTGAFAAEYGNALSGVFDLKLRKGNNEKREYTFQASLLGMDAAVEGPFRRGGHGSYLVNYRYSTLSLLGLMGVELGDAVTKFQDLSFNISMPTEKAGQFTLFGFGGLSNQFTLAQKDSLKWQENDYYRMNYTFFANTGMTGLTHTRLFNNQSWMKTIVAVSATDNGDGAEELQNDYSTTKKIFDERFLQKKITLSSVYTRKLTPRSSYRTGVIVNHLKYELFMKEYIDSLDLLQTKIESDGNYQTIQAFGQWNYKPGEKWSANAGLHFIRLFLNGSQSIEPRASLRYEMNPRHSFTLGYGLHSQVQPIALYFVKLSDGTQPNKNLGLSMAHHGVLGYGWKATESHYLKTEVYFQHLFNVPVSADVNSTYSVLNSIWDYRTEKLVNDGWGRNYGVDLSFEQFLNKGMYYLVSASLFESRYKANDGKWYDTRFNTNYSLVLTLGKEWTLSAKRKGRVIGINLKSLYVGGFRYTPIDLQASQMAGEAQYDYDQTFGKKHPDYWRLDLRFSVKRNYARATGTLALDLQNSTNHKNVGGQYFDGKTGEVKYWYQTPLIPVLSYRLEF